jgi:hypothetical protein
MATSAHSWFGNSRRHNGSSVEIEIDGVMPLDLPLYGIQEKEFQPRMNTNIHE